MWLRPTTILFAIQFGLAIAANLLGIVIYKKIAPYGPAALVYDWGFVLVLFPLLWIALALYTEKKGDDEGLELFIIGGIVWSVVMVLICLACVVGPFLCAGPEI